jgi:purine-binding chemotaxis protein CheW
MSFTREERAVLEARARALATVVESGPPRLEAEALALVVGGERYAITTAAVRVAAAVDRLAPLPHAPPEVAGLVAHGGNLLPAFDLRALLGLPLGSLPEHGRMLVLGREEDELGLIVDAIDGLVGLGASPFRPVPDDVSRDVRAFALGLTAEGIPVLDADAILRSSRVTVDIPVPRAHAASPGEQT